nr:MAG TPA: hypothetical protein [Caudoviricetes sp.]
MSCSKSKKQSRLQVFTLKNGACNLLFYLW